MNITRSQAVARRADRTALQ